LIKVAQIELSAFFPLQASNENGPPGLIFNVHRSSALSDKAVPKRSIRPIFLDIVSRCTHLDGVPILSRSGSLPWPFRLVHVKLPVFPLVALSLKPSG